MNIEINKHLFYVCAGLTASGSNGYDHADGDVVRLADLIYAANFSQEVKAWFSRARTGQVEVNPYWPRGSILAAACFFIDGGIAFDHESFFAFLESAGGVHDPIGPDDLTGWLMNLPATLHEMDSSPAAPALWEEYRRIAEALSPRWRERIDSAMGAARGFFGDDCPEMVFSPNLFTPYSADFVTIGKRIITIASNPDPETMLHETMHTVVAKSRPTILKYAKRYGLRNIADKEKMAAFGYLADESAASYAHVIEECFARALSVVLAGEGEQRLRSHAEFGFDAVAPIAARMVSMRPSAATLNEFIAGVLEELKPRENG